MKKKILCALFLACALNSGVMMASAGSLTGYSGYVKKTQDIVTEMRKKETTSVGTNWVEYVEGERYLTCWIQKSGKRITETKTYNNTGYQRLGYDDPVSAEGAYVSLAVSTNIVTVQQTYSFGSWSPDDVD